MANPLNFQVTTFSGSVENAEFNFRNLYLHHIISGPNRNQANIIAKDGATGWGVTAVNNWSIYDGTGPDAKLVARAQGLHIYAGSWHNSFSIVFEAERFKGSTLEVMGASPEKEGDWAIVGGTGELALARGIINRKVHEKLGNGEIPELTIHGYCKTSKQPSTLRAIGAWGEIPSRGFSHDIYPGNIPRRLESITVTTGGQYIDSLSYSFVNEAGEKSTNGPWGLVRGTTYLMELKPSEVVKEVWVTVGKYNGDTVITSLKFVTNENVYGPYGNEQGPAFSAKAPDSQSILGFFGTSTKTYVQGIGVFVSKRKEKELVFVQPELPGNLVFIQVFSLVPLF